MSGKSTKIEEIYYAALEKKNQQERSAYLDEICGTNLALRTRVVALLKADEEAGDFLKMPSESQSIFLGESIKEKSGAIIGRYKLLEKIGEGGMATVYMAEQEQPIRRKVALKIIKLGMDTKQVIARFEVERQALALMEHPNIAKVHDAGTTETGRPYFVMELVKGLPITKYCDENNLTTKERLDLFIQVCQAVQHAHQKGIIHRDLKPTNVLVTLHDGRPVPKIIDFGIAKATKQKLTEKTLFTQYAQLIGTPEYMSPEQAEWSDLDIDTRTDIYSLGVLLYELLTSTTPFDAKALREAGYSKMQKIICEEEPTKPSTKISGLGETLAEVAKHRQTSPDLLRKLVRGDLDWIVMKAMEKDRTRRYATTAELEADIERNLNNEPVLAAAPSLPYKLGKFIRRNRVGVVAGSLVLASLLIGFVGTTVGFIRAENQRDLAETNFLKSEENRRRAEANFKRAHLAVYAMMNVARDLAKESHMENIYKPLLDEARKFYQEFLHEKTHDPQMRKFSALTYIQIAEIHHALGQEEKAEQNYRQAIDLLKKLTSEYSDQMEYQDRLGSAHWSLGVFFCEIGKHSDAQKHLRLAVNIHEKLVKVDSTASSSKYYSSLLSSQQALAYVIHRAEQGDSEKGKAKVRPLSGLGLVFWRTGRLRDSRSDLGQSWASWREPPPLRSDRLNLVEIPDAVTVVVPNILENTEGEDRLSSKFFGYAFRGQQVFPASEFKALPGPMYLTQYATRSDESVAGTRTIIYKDFQLRCSTAPKGPGSLNEDFMDNVGYDEEIVYEGMLTRSVVVPYGPGPNDFVYILNMQKSFRYDPNQGNLLLDFRTGSGPSIALVQDGHSLLGDQFTVAPGRDSSGGLVSSGGGAVHQYTFIPASYSFLEDPVGAIELIPASALLEEGPQDKVQLRVRALKHSGLASDVTTETIYTSQCLNVATVSSGGSVKAVTPGVGMVVAEFTDPVSGKTFSESQIFEVVQLSDFLRSNTVNENEKLRKGGGI